MKHAKTKSDEVSISGGKDLTMGLEKSFYLWSEFQYSLNSFCSGIAALLLSPRHNFFFDASGTS